EVNQIGNELNNAVNMGAKRPNNLNTPSRSQPMPATPPENKNAPPTEESKPDESDQEKDA
ncbi:hypothetical protein U8M34_28600, partial [Klebsiella pneumoniae]|uniref:hypothetical protein n=1 Tax=Klebsiella pneumoniae TaxID=573 RepID=UPI002AE062D5